MTINGGATIHASAVLAGDRAVLIRGPSGSGKSRLAFALILAGQAGQSQPVTLIGDDRVRLTERSGFLYAQGARELAGKIEIRGLGLRTVAFSAEGPLGLVVDLAAADAERLPSPQALRVVISGLEIPRIPVGAGYDPLPLVLAFLTTT